MGGNARYLSFTVKAPLFLWVYINMHLFAWISNNLFGALCHWYMHSINQDWLSNLSGIWCKRDACQIVWVYIFLHKHCQNKCFGKKNFLLFKTESAGLVKPGTLQTLMVLERLLGCLALHYLIINTLRHLSNIIISEWVIVLRVAFELITIQMTNYLVHANFGAACRDLMFALFVTLKNACGFPLFFHCWQFCSLVTII